MNLRKVVEDRFCKGRFIAYFDNRIEVFFKHDLKTLSSLFGAVIPCGLAATVMLTSQAHALPGGEQVVAGQVTFNQQGNTYNVNAATNKSIVNYQNFNVGQNQTVNFNLPSSQSAILNRVVGNSASNIFGQLNSNGHVFLTNPNGIVFGANSQVNVGSLTASTLGISNEDFLNSNYVFTQEGKKGGAVITRGLIQAADGGSVNLLGSAVENSGVISASGGQVNLAVGQQVSMTVEDGIGVNVVVDEALEKKLKNYKDGISNTGVIQTAGGTTQLKALVGDVYQKAVNNSGVVEANGFASQNGKIVIAADGNVENSGALLAEGAEGGTGGAINIESGKSTTLTDTSLISVKGAGENSDAGTVYIMSEDDTHFKGVIDAEGGSVSGDAGFIEVSAKDVVNLGGDVKLKATNGNYGTLLIDPTNINIANGDPNYAPGIIGSWYGYISLAATNLLSVSDAVNFQNASSVNLSGGNVNVNANITTNNAPLWIGASGTYSGGTGGTGGTGSSGGTGGTYTPGVLTVANGVSLNTGNSSVTLQAPTINIYSSGSTSTFNVGASSLTLTANNTQSVPGAINAPNITVVGTSTTTTTTGGTSGGSGGTGGTGGTTTTTTTTAPGNLSVQSTAGPVNIKNINAAAVNVSGGLGTVTLGDVTSTSTYIGASSNVVTGNIDASGTGGININAYTLDAGNLTASNGIVSIGATGGTGGSNPMLSTKNITGVNGVNANIYSGSTGTIQVDGSILSTNGTVNITAPSFTSPGNLSIQGKQVSINALTQAGGSLSITSTDTPTYYPYTGILLQKNTTAQGDITLTAQSGGNISTQNLSTPGNVVATTTGANPGTISVVDVAANGDVQMTGSNIGVQDITGQGANTSGVVTLTTNATSSQMYGSGMLSVRNILANAINGTANTISLNGALTAQGAQGTIDLTANVRPGGGMMGAGGTITQFGTANITADNNISMLSDKGITLNALNIQSNLGSILMNADKAALGGAIFLAANVNADDDIDLEGSGINADKDLLSVSGLIRVWATGTDANNKNLNMKSATSIGAKTIQLKTFTNGTITAEDLVSTDVVNNDTGTIQVETGADANGTRAAINVGNVSGGNLLFTGNGITTKNLSTKIGQNLLSVMLFNSQSNITVNGIVNGPGVLFQAKHDINISKTARADSLQLLADSDKTGNPMQGGGNLTVGENVLGKYISLQGSKISVPVVSTNEAGDPLDGDIDILATGTAGVANSGVFISSLTSKRNLSVTADNGAPINLTGSGVVAPPGVILLPGHTTVEKDITLNAKSGGGNVAGTINVIDITAKNNMVMTGGDITFQKAVAPGNLGIVDGRNSLTVTGTSISQQNFKTESDNTVSMTAIGANGYIYSSSNNGIEAKNIVLTAPGNITVANVNSQATPPEGGGGFDPFPGIQITADSDNQNGGYLRFAGGLLDGEQLVLSSVISKTPIFLTGSSVEAGTALMDADTAPITITSTDTFTKGITVRQITTTGNIVMNALTDSSIVIKGIIAGPDVARGGNVTLTTAKVNGTRGTVTIDTNAAAGAGIFGDVVTVNSRIDQDSRDAILANTLTVNEN